MSLNKKTIPVLILAFIVKVFFDPIVKKSQNRT